MSVANLTDMSLLATDTTFGNRVLEALIQYCTNVVPTEAVASTADAAQLHIQRKQEAAAIMNNPTQFKPLFVNAVAANQIVANDATVNGTLVGQTPTQITAAAALCTDTDINNAVAAAFNAFIGNV